MAGLTVSSQVSVGSNPALAADLAGAASTTSHPATPHWQAPQLIDPLTGNVSAVSCPSPSFCLAVDGLGNALTYDGGSWTRATPVAAGHVPLTAVTCVSADFCMALDDLGRLRSYDGHAWSTAARPLHTITVTAVSCVSPTFCIAGGYAQSTAYAAVWDGQAWGQRTILPEAPTALSCATPTFCMAVDGDRGAFSFDGATWSARQDLGSGLFLSVSCPTPTFCAAGTSNGRVLTYDGTRWADATVLGGKSASLSLLSCPSAVFCVVAAGGLYSIYDGDGWSPLEKFAGPVVTGLSCPSDALCIAVRQQTDYLTFDGSAWTLRDQLEPGHPNLLQSVSCPTMTFCAAVDRGGSAFTYDGSTWSAPVHVLDSSLLTVQCPTPSFCLAVSDSSGGRTVVFDGSSWSPGPTLPGDVDLPQVSCTSAHFCLAVEGDGSVYRFDGTAWTEVASITPDTVQLSCGSATFCVVGGRFHGVSIWDGTDVVPDPTFPLGAVSGMSCTASRFCMASGEGGWSTYDGSGWSAPAAPYPFDRISCASARFCASVNALAMFRIFRDGSWSEAKNLPIRHQAPYTEAAVSCATARFCMAVTNGGYALAYR